MEKDQLKGDLDSRFKIYHELMAKKISQILVLSTPYDAWIMDEDCRLSERIVNEYRGLNLSHPPRLTWVSTAQDALAALETKRFDMVITNAGHIDTEGVSLGLKVKAKHPDLPMILLAHSARPPEEYPRLQEKQQGIDRTFIWSGNTDLLVSLIKSAEDRLNVAHDTKCAGIRVIIFVEDSPTYISSLLPILYRELVVQVQTVIGEGLNEEHRLLAMRARPKILIAQTYEEALGIYEEFEPYVLGVISDVCFSRHGRLDDHAGVDLLKRVKKDRFDIPLLLTSSEPSNAEKASEIPALFVDKNSPSLHSEVRSFLLNHLGFGKFVFRMPDGKEIARAHNLRSLEKHLASIPDESLNFHSKRNDFSRWLFARSEIELASKVRPIRGDSFSSIKERRNYLASIIRARRMQRQKGVVVNFEPGKSDMDIEFFKIGQGSLGGKARGLAFLTSFLHRNSELQKKFHDINIIIPQTLVITTDGFDAFIEANNLTWLSKSDQTDEQIAAHFMAAELPDWIVENLQAYLTQIKYPLAVRSSGLLEDAQFRAYAGLYRTYMLPNDDPDLEKRLAQLLKAVKLVYASTYYKDPKSFSQRVGHRTEEEKMAVIIQQLVGQENGPSFYPAISGVAQSYNYYPVSKMKSEDGVATIALGLGKTVMQGGKTLRFCPQYPQLQPERSTVEDILDNAQQQFYALKLKQTRDNLGVDEDATLEKRNVADAVDEPAINQLAGTYLPEDHRIRDTAQIPGYKVLTFANVLKYDLFPLADILKEILTLGQAGMGCPVELEFSVNLRHGTEGRPEFAIVQLRPMTARADLMHVEIRKEEIDKAFCFSTQALGNGINQEISDIVFVKPDTFDAARTPQIAHEIGQMNAKLQQSGRKYLLVGPGRWGSKDRWLGIPVSWSDICGVGAIIETAWAELKAEPSQGSHFFHNITTLGINYLTVSDNGNDFFDWNRIASLPIQEESEFTAHVRFENQLTLKVDGRKSHAIILF